MKLALFLLLSVLSLNAPSVCHADDAHQHAESVRCDCPPDCHCHQEGGSCPGTECSEDCDCDKFETIDGRLIYIHPSMREAISKTELRMQGGKKDNDADYIVVDGVKQYTGFKPDWNFYRGADTLNVKVPEDYVMKEIDFSVISHSPVRGQIQGSCWAEGCGSAFEFSTNAVNGTKNVYSVQDVIDCSGFGSARNGGYSSLAYALAGLALESDYSYKGYDQRCKQNVSRHQPLKRAPFIRGANGGMPTEREINYVLNTMGAMEVCGSAASLGSGGWQETARSGGTDHCYAHAGMRWGPNHGKAAKWYHGMKNSWGDGTPGTLNPQNRSWGNYPRGYGWYALAKEVGGRISGSVITELQLADAGPMKPKEPILFSIESRGVTASIIISVEDQESYSKESLTASLMAAYAVMEAAL